MILEDTAGAGPQAAGATVAGELRGPRTRSPSSSGNCATKEDYLQTTLEEMETTNEELKSTNEEMQSVNEELQSTNEELETSKEETAVGERGAVDGERRAAGQSGRAFARQQRHEQPAGRHRGRRRCSSTTSCELRRFTPAATQVINLIPPTSVGRSSHMVPNLVGYDRLVARTFAGDRYADPIETEVQTKDGAGI